MSAGVADPIRNSNQRRVRAPSRLDQHLTILLLLASLCALLILARPLFEGSAYVYDDMLGLMLPIRHFYERALKSGDNVLWAPQIFCGFYLHGEGTLGITHPWHWLLYRTLPLTTAFNIEFLSAYVMLFPGTYLLLRTWKLPRASCLLGALLFTFHGFNMMHYMHMHAIAIIAHIPWLMILDRIVLTTRNRRVLAAAQLGITLLTASQILLGYPYYVYYSTLMEGVYILWLCRSWVGWQRCALLLVAKLLAFAVSMIQLMPFFPTLQESIRAAPDSSFRTAFSMHPLNLVQLWSPFAFNERYYAEQRWTDANTHEMGLYMGAVATVSVFWLWMRRKHLGRYRKLAFATTVFALIMLLMATGRYGKFYNLMSHLPVLSKGRAPVRHVLLAQLALAILSSIALWDLLKLARRGVRARWRALSPLSVPVFLSLATLLWCLWVVDGPPSVAKMNIAGVERAALGLGLMVVVCGLFAAAARGHAWAPYAIILAVGVEICWHEIAHVWSTPPRRVSEIIASARKPPSPPSERVFHYSNPDAGALSLAGYNITGGYLALVPRRAIPDYWPNVEPYLHLSGVRYAYGDDHEWHELEMPILPRARLVNNAVLSTNVGRDIYSIEAGSTVLVDRDLQIDRMTPPGKAKIFFDRPGAIDIETDSPGRQFLVLAESFHSGWKLTIDGNPAEPLRAYQDFLGCVVGPGKNRVSFRFEPESFTQGVRATAAGLTLSLILTLLIAVWPARHSPEKA